MDTPGGSERILVVDDEEMILQIYSDFLETLGYRVTTSASSVKALAAFRENPDAYDLVMMDIIMPDMTGYELAKEISDCRSDIPIIMSTGYRGHGAGNTARALGVDAFLTKPANLKEIALTVRRVIDSKRPDNGPEI